MTTKITRSYPTEKNKYYISVAKFVQESKLLKITDQRLALKIQKIKKS